MKPLKKRKDFLAIAACNRKFITKSMVIQYRKRNKELPPSTNQDKTIRIGFTVTKKLGSAVTRNRIKRRLREAVRLTMPEHAKAGFDYVFIGRANAKDCNFEELKQEIRFAMSHIHYRTKKKTKL